MKPKPLAVELPRIDAGTQSRIAINEDVVQDYADLIAESKEWPFPPLDVFHDGSEYFVADGFHRLLAARRTTRGSIPSRVHEGTATDARIFGMTANDRHGLRMTRADKRACVEWLLDNGGKMTQKEIAEAAGVGVRSVKMVIAERNPVSIAGKASPPKRYGKGQIAPSTPIRGDSDPFDDTEDPFGEDGGMDSEDAQEPGHRPPRKGKDKPVDYGKCPNCAGAKWKETEDGVSCARCHHPHGEVTGGPDEDRITTQKQKTVKTAEALMRAFDDLQLLSPKTREHGEAIETCKVLLKTARQWC